MTTNNQKPSTCGFEGSEGDRSGFFDIGSFRFVYVKDGRLLALKVNDGRTIHVVDMVHSLEDAKEQAELYVWLCRICDLDCRAALCEMRKINSLPFELAIRICSCISKEVKAMTD